MTFRYKGAAKRLDDLDLPRIGATIGVGEDEIHAVLEVEAAGSGFDSQGRVKALYEPHVAWRLSKGATRDALVRAGLAYQSWGAKPYPKDSYPRILAAAAIDEEIALKATSWGLGQIMGFNHGAAGFPTVQAMVGAFAEDEERHLEGMIRFITVNGLDDEIRRHDWAGFARGYNGAGYAKNKYDQKLAAAFVKWRKIKDTPWPPAHVVPPAAPVVIPAAPTVAPAISTPPSPPPPPPDRMLERGPPPSASWWSRLWSGFFSAAKGP